MPRRPREFVDGGIYHVFSRGNDRRKIFLEKEDFHCFLNMTHCALEVASKLKSKFANLGVIDLYSLPINEKPFLNEIRGAGKIITLEEHTLPGGFGSAVCELLSDNNLHIPLKRMGLDLSKGYCYKYGGRKNIQSIFGLDAENVASSVSEFLGKK